MENMIIEKYDDLYRFAFKLTRDESRANDLTQDTILKALSGKLKFDGISKLKNWLFTIMRNEFINQYRYIKIRRNVKVKSDLSDIQAYHSVNSDSLAIVNDIENITENIKFYDLLQMHMNGFKYKEIAEQFKIPIGTVKSRIYLARKEFNIKYT